MLLKSRESASFRSYEKIINWLEVSSNRAEIVNLHVVERAKCHVMNPWVGEAEMT